MKSKITHGWNSYLDWAAQHSGAYGANGPELWEPVFVRSIDVNLSTQDFFASVDAEDDYAFDPFELSYNAQFRASGEPVEALLLRKHKEIRPSTTFKASLDILHVGALGPRTEASRSAPSFPQSTSPKPAAIGIIDDGIGYLHPRFQNGLGQTRFAGMLMQTLPTLSTSNSDHSCFGQALSAAEINADLNALQSASEDELYRARYSAIFDPLTRHGMRQMASHGTLMLDMAAGADPIAASDASMRDVPLLGVQLPPEAFEDTSGVRMQTHVVQGLRWMIYRAFADNLVDELVVNISLGVVAGPKNGGSFLEQQMKREIERVETHYSGAKTLELVFAYGNAYEDGLVARANLAAAASKSVTLCLQPDDHTANFVEMRLTDFSVQSKPKRIEVTLTAPDGTSATRTLRKGRHATFFGTQSAPIARLYHTPAREIWGGVSEPAYLTLALAQTATTKTGDVLAPSGHWTIECRNVSNDAMDLTLQVQRDDSPFSRSTGARQAYLDDPLARSWNVETRDFSALDPASIITHEGTNSAFATVAHDNAHSVGAALVRHDVIEPAVYTAKGANWSGAAPDGSTIAEMALATPGVLGAGSFASGTARLSGTSTAAASYTRHLIKPVATAPVMDQYDRLGTLAVIENPAIKDQRQDDPPLVG